MSKSKTASVVKITVARRQGKILVNGASHMEKSNASHPRDVFLRTVEMKKAVKGRTTRDSNRKPKAVEIGKMIRRYRKQKKMTQRELGRQVNLDVCTISLYERGKYRPSALALAELAKALEVSTDALLNYEPLHAEMAVNEKSKITDLDLMDMLSLMEKFSKKDREVIKTIIHAIAKKDRIL